MFQTPIKAIKLDKDEKRLRPVEKQERDFSTYPAVQQFNYGSFDTRTKKRTFADRDETEVKLDSNGILQFSKLTLLEPTQPV
jgi:hypothetical protein